MQDNIITWNATNWITIVLMALLGFAVLSVATSFVRHKFVAPMPQQQTAQA